MVKLLSLLTVLLLAAGSAQALGDLLIQDAQFDFGAVPQGSTVAHRFRLIDAGEKSIRVTAIKTGCACIALYPNALQDSTVVLAPGDTVAVTLLWQMRLTLGKVARQILVLTDASPEPLRIKLEATVEEPGSEMAGIVACRPTCLDFGSPITRQQMSATLRMQNSTGDDLSVSVISPAYGEMQAAFPDTIPAGQVAVGYVTIADTGQTIELERSMTLSFRRGESEVYRRTIPVTRGDFSYRPFRTK